jgi:hypothetical protein
MIVAVVLVLACLAVLAAVVALAMGRGGELSAAPRDLPPLPPSNDRPFVGPEPVALPRAFWGYQVEMTDQAMGRLRTALYERDVRMAALERQIIELRHRVREDLEDDPEDTPAVPEPAAPELVDPELVDSEPAALENGYIDGATRVDLVKNNASASDRSGENEARS